MDTIDSYITFVDNHYWSVVFGLFIIGQILLYNVRRMEVRNQEDDEYNFLLDNYFPISIVLYLWCMFWYMTLPFTLIGVAIILLVIGACIITRRKPPVKKPIVLQCEATDWNRVVDRAMYMWFDDVFTRQVVTNHHENPYDFCKTVIVEFKYIFFVDHSQRHRIDDGFFILEKVEIL